MFGGIEQSLNLLLKKAICSFDELIQVECPVTTQFFEVQALFEVVSRTIYFCVASDVLRSFKCENFCIWCDRQVG